jgi:hypothetical protein
MADLSDKGMTFSSELIIICTNLSVHGADLGLRNHQKPIDVDAVARRFRCPIQIYSTDFERSEIRYRDLTDYLQKMYCVSRRRLDNDNGVNTYCLPGFSTVPIQNLVDSVCARAKNAVLDTAYRLGLDLGWRQVVLQDGLSFDKDSQLHTSFSQQESCSLSYTFPMSPPQDVPICRTCCVPKALGARMVTVGQAETRCLKPLQEALWKALGDFPEYRATHGVDLETVFRENLSSILDFDPEYQLLSGDYKSATDYLNMDLSQSILSGILHEIDHQPTADWALWENGKHLIEYPSFTGLKPVEQQNGQLMGSLLSFPLLCLANSLLCDEAGIGPRMINGDDLLCAVTEQQAEKWFELGEKLGLKPSIGKTYKSFYWGTFNSKLLLRDGSQPSHMNLSLLFREDKPVDRCFSDFLNLGGCKEDIVEFNRSFLLKDVRSLDIPASHGGLGNAFVPGRQDNQFDRLNYLHLLNKKSDCTLPDLAGVLPKGLAVMAIPRDSGIFPRHYISHRTRESCEDRSLFFPLRIDKRLQPEEESFRCWDAENSGLVRTVSSLLSQDQVRKERQQERKENVSYKEIRSLKKIVAGNEGLRLFVSKKPDSPLPELQDLPALNEMKVDYCLCARKNLKRYKWTSLEMFMRRHGLLRRYSSESTSNLCQDREGIVRSGYEVFRSSNLRGSLSSLSSAQSDRCRSQMHLTLSDISIHSFSSVMSELKEWNSDWDVAAADL